MSRAKRETTWLLTMERCAKAGKIASVAADAESQANSPFVRLNMKRGYRLRPGDQVPTSPTTVHEIMSSPAFALGVADARAGRLYRAAYQAFHTNGQWNYERGRQWARLVPASVILKRNGKITREAAEWARRQFKYIL